MKKLLTIITGIFLFILPLKASGAYSTFQYPNIPVLKEASGVFHIYLQKQSKWEEVGSISCDKYFRQKALDISRYISENENRVIKVMLKKQGGGMAHIDSVLINGKAPLSISGIDAEIKKVKTDDFDVIDATDRGIEVEFSDIEGKAILSLTARIEESVISKVPFQYPVSNLTKR